MRRFQLTPRRIAAGSPLLGRPIADLDEPVTKTSYAAFALREGLRPDKQSSCISCGECRQVCPVGLDPEELYKRTQIGNRGESLSDDSRNRAAECHGCGCCEVVCPSRLPLSTAITSSALRGN